jgi:hypothetical protein
MNLIAATDLLAAVRAAGGDLLAVGDRLRVTAPEPLPVDLVERLRAAKSELLAMLSTPAAAPWTDAEEERAAIVEDGAGVRPAWAEGFAPLDATRPPGDVPLGRWRAFLDDAGRFLDSGWCDRALALGWTPLQLFGCNRHRPYARVDQAGLIWILNGRALAALTSELAVIDASPSVRQTIRRRPAEPGSVVLPWNLVP